MDGYLARAKRNYAEAVGRLRVADPVRATESDRASRDVMARLHGLVRMPYELLERVVS